MTPGPADPGLRAVVLDVEGTTTPIAYVYDVLFPYARERLSAYLQAHAGDPNLIAVLRQLREERLAESGDDQPRELRADEPLSLQLASAADYARWLMDRDRKSTGLKALQGLIWQEGFERGVLRGEVFPDVGPALERWAAAGRRTAIFSSGSVLAQRLLFRYSTSGDLSSWLHAHFDTTTGPKVEPASYRRIAAAIDEPPRNILFVSDVVGELDAAREAGMRTVLSQRPGNPPPRPHDHPAIDSFDEIP